jgi:lysophospholipase L1-like esterase
MNGSNRNLCGAVVAFAVVALAGCGGGAADEGGTASSESMPGATASSNGPDAGQPSTQQASILDEWLNYEDPDSPQPVETAADPVAALLGKAARLNQKTLEAARKKQGASLGSAPKHGFVGLVPVYRFYNSVTGAHFYTASELERDQVIASASSFQYEGPAFQVSPNPQAGLSPVYRFLNTSTGVHLYTISEPERDLIQANLPAYQFEGVAYYASMTGGSGLAPLYRFFQASRNFHFYTAQYTERDNLIANACNYNHEGTAYYVFDANAVVEPPPARTRSTVLVVGDSLARGYGVSIGGNPYSFVTPGQVWTERLATEIKTRTGLNCNKVINVSVGGMRTVEGVNGIQGWLNQYAPTHVILAQGTNDAWQRRSVGSMTNNLTNMANASKAANANVFVMEFAFYPSGYGVTRQTMTNMYLGVATNTQSSYINGTGNVPANATYYHPDSVHLKDAAQPRVLETVWQSLQPFL